MDGKQYLALLSFVESIDRHVTSVDGKVDTLLGTAVTEDDCATCKRDMKSNFVDKRYFLGISGVILVLSQVRNLWETLTGH